MTPAIVITLVVSVSGVIFASITAPLILARRTERMHREDRAADYQRQDKMAAEAQALADRAASHAIAAGKVTNGKLDVIHGLVNSNMSAALQAALDAHITSLAMMREVADLKRSAGQEPGSEAATAISSTEASIIQLRATLNDRLQQAEAIAARAAAAAVQAQTDAEDAQDRAT